MCTAFAFPNHTIIALLKDMKLTYLLVGDHLRILNTCQSMGVSKICKLCCWCILGLPKFDCNLTHFLPLSNVTWLDSWKSHWSNSLLTFLQDMIFSESMCRCCIGCVCVWGGGAESFTTIYEDMKILKAAVIMWNQYMQYNVYTFAYHLVDKQYCRDSSVIVVM